MTGRVRIRLNINTLRVTGATGAEAVALASALRESLSARLAGDPGALSALSAPSISVTLPQGGSTGPAGLGQAAGRQIASALMTPKAPKAGR